MKSFIIILMSVFLLVGCWQDSELGNDNDNPSPMPVDTDSDTGSDEPFTIDEEELVASVPAKEADDCALIETPFDKCSDNHLITFTGEVTFYNGQCNFTFELEECASSCERVENNDHRCVMPCDSMKCDTPPEDKLETSYLIEYHDTGICIDEYEDWPQNWAVEPQEVEPFCHYKDNKTDYDCESNEYLVYNTEIQDYECYTCPDGYYVEIIVIDELAAGFECVQLY